MSNKIEELEEHIKNMEIISKMHKDAGMRIITSGNNISRKALVRILEKVLSYPHPTGKASQSPEEDALMVCISEKLRVVLQQTILAMQLEQLKSKSNNEVETSQGE